jgi:uncharacterized protein YndB with AHSA1/START domain
LVHLEPDSKAPVISRQHAHIAAPLERVWSLLIDIDCWPEWNPGVPSVELEGSPAPGAIFRWKSGRFTIVSRLQDVEPMKRLSWTGRAAGISAVHAWTFEQEGDGVLVRTTESLDGLLAHLFKPMLQRFLDISIEQGLHSLKQAAERGET